MRKSNWRRATRKTAQKLAQQALDEQEEDPGRALFILAQVATANRDMEGARTYFERALETSARTEGHRVVAYLPGAYF